VGDSVICSVQPLDNIYKLVTQLFLNLIKYIHCLVYLSGLKRQGIPEHPTRI
jgi:hypothetical protein